jgi:hypothetical protein
MLVATWRTNIRRWQKEPLQNTKVEVVIRRTMSAMLPDAA